MHLDPQSQIANLKASGRNRDTATEVDVCTGAGAKIAHGRRPELQCSWGRHPSNWSALEVAASQKRVPNPTGNESRAIGEGGAFPEGRSDRRSRCGSADANGCLKGIEP
jgi:hypothetical protein